MSPRSARPGENPAEAPGPGDDAAVAWLDEAEKRAWMALLEVGSGLFDLLSRDLKAMSGLALEDYEILHLLSEAPQRRLRIGELADRMLASRTRLSQRIDRLTERGILRRERCPEDGRAINVILTDQGRDLLAEIAPRHLLTVRRRVFDHLTRRDVVAIGSSLEKLGRYLHEQRGALVPRGQDQT
jgi:DNA-binding MarR family transcriptional regulator